MKTAFTKQNLLEVITKGYNFRLHGAVQTVLYRTSVRGKRQVLALPLFLRALMASGDHQELLDLFGLYTPLFFLNNLQYF